MSEDNKSSSIVDVGNPFRIEVTYDVFESIRDLSVTYHLFNSEGILLFESMDTDMPEWKGRTREPGRYLAMCTIPKHLLKPGRYHLSVHSFIERVKMIERQDRVLTFDVSDVGYLLNPGRLGAICPVLEWKVTRRDGMGSSTMNE
ncbi:MAG: Wzt carbohydrate-binding domain-containing protein [Chloroflexi bacterium]|nr:Wzt carbohydrate-binding domain-containing protein [Chloroflexota bacterium]